MYDYTLTDSSKKTVEQYKLNFDLGNYVNVMIDPIGDITFTGDFGEYSYSWRSFGDRTFKEFFSDLDSGYLYNKLCKEDYFDFAEWKAKALKALDKNIDFLDSEEIKIIKDAIQVIDEIDDCTYVQMKIWEDREIGKVYDEVHYADFFPQLSYSPRQIAFIERVIPALQKLLKEEIYEGPYE